MLIFFTWPSENYIYTHPDNAFVGNWNLHSRRKTIVTPRHIERGTTINPINHSPLCQDWAVDWAPTDLQNGPINGGAGTKPLPTKLLSLRNFQTKVGEGSKERTLRCSQPGQASLAWAAKPINAATPGLGTSVCYLPLKHHHALVIKAQPDQGECRHKYKQSIGFGE